MNTKYVLPKIIVKNQICTSLIGLSLGPIEYFMLKSVNPVVNYVDKDLVIFHNAITLYHLELLTIFTIIGSVVAWIFLRKVPGKLEKAILLVVITLSNVVSLIFIEDISYFLSQFIASRVWISANDWTCLHLGCVTTGNLITPLWYFISLVIISCINLLVLCYSYFKCNKTQGSLSK